MAPSLPKDDMHNLSYSTLTNTRAKMREERARNRVTRFPKIPKIFAYNNANVIKVDYVSEFRISRVSSIYLTASNTAPRQNVIMDLTKLC